MDTWPEERKVPAARTHRKTEKMRWNGKMRGEMMHWSHIQEALLHAMGDKTLSKQAVTQRTKGRSITIQFQ